MKVCGIHLDNNFKMHDAPMGSFDPATSMKGITKLLVQHFEGDASGEYRSRIKMLKPKKRDGPPNLLLSMFEKEPQAHMPEPRLDRRDRLPHHYLRLLDQCCPPDQKRYYKPTVSKCRCLC